MPDSIIGRRDTGDDRWNWGPPKIPGRQPDNRPRLPVLVIVLVTLGAILIGAGILLLLLSTGGDDSSGSQATATRSSALDASTSPGSTAQSTESATSASPSPATGKVRLFIWSRQQKQWLTSDLEKDEPGYHEGEYVPFMLLIENASSAGLYDIEVKYECHTTNGAAFDYLSSVATGDSDALTTAPGPGRREDASIPIPDDSTITFDGGGRRFRVWGGSFQQTPEGPLPVAPCQNDKRFRVSLIAQGGTVSMIWAGHLASRNDWGENQGASSQQSAIHVETTVNEMGPQKLGIGPDATAP